MTFRALRTAPLLLLLLASCEKDGGIPSFVRIIGPTAKSADGGATVPSAVTDLWVYANDEAVGVWQANRRIPVLASGHTTIKVIAGVRRNGITDDRIQYPFYATWVKEVDLTEGQETILEPVFEYYHAPVWSEGFEAGQQFDTSDSDTTFVPYDSDVDSLEVLVGDKAVGIVLDPAHDFFRAVRTETPYFPNGTEPTFLEIDYRSDTRFLVGVTYLQNGQTQAVPYVYVSPTKLSDGSMPWRHIYIDLSTAWGTSGNTERQFYIQAQLEDGATSAHITLDNLNAFH